MAFVVHVKIPGEYEQLSIFDEFASSLCEDKIGKISGRAGKESEEYKFSVKEDKKSTPPGLITVTATIVIAADPKRTVKDTQTVTYHIPKSGEHFEFPKLPA